MDDEIWRDIEEGYEEHYQVSNFGRVKSFHKGERILKPGLTGRGYLGVNLWLDGKVKNCKVYRLVAQTFIPNPESKREVNHINGIKADNRVENLEWVTPSENMRHALQTGLQLSGEDCSWAKLTNEQVLYIRENPDGLTNMELATKFAVCHQLISQVQLGKVFKNVGGTIRKNKLPDPKRIPDEIREQIRREYIPNVQGHSASALAKKYGVGSSSVWRIVHEI